MYKNFITFIYFLNNFIKQFNKKRLRLRIAFLTYETIKLALLIGLYREIIYLIQSLKNHQFVLDLDTKYLKKI